jgi:hypothetical protein
MVSNALWNVWKSAVRPLEVPEFAVSDAPALGSELRDLAPEVFIGWTLIHRHRSDFIMYFG